MYINRAVIEIVSQGPGHVGQTPSKPPSHKSQRKPQRAISAPPLPSQRLRHCSLCTQHMPAKHTPGPVAGTENGLGLRFWGAYCWMGRRGSVREVRYVTETVTAATPVSCPSHTVRHSCIPVSSSVTFPQGSALGGWVGTLLHKSLTEW